MHYYVKNLQGDIIRVVNEAGNTVASYEYDAWGKLLSAKNYYGVPVTDPNSIVLVNPLRYRGYVVTAQPPPLYQSTVKREIIG